MLKNLFGGKKKEFFIELDDFKTPTPEAKVDSVPAPTTETVVKTKEPASKAKQKSDKNKAKDTKKVASEITPVVVPAKAVKVEPTEVQFATQYFASNSSRRTPGPSLAKFKEMARQSKSVK